MTKLSSLLNDLETASKQEQTLGDWYNQNHHTAPRPVVSEVFHGYEEARKRRIDILHRILESVGDVDIT